MIGTTALQVLQPGLCLSSLFPVKIFSSRESLEHSLARVDEQDGRVKVGKRLRAEIESEAGGPKILALRGAVMAFVKNVGSGQHQENTTVDEGDNECLEEIEARFHGAEVVKKLDNNRLTHVVIVGEELKEGIVADVREERRKRLREGKNIFHLVSSAWVEASVRENRLVSEGEFAL